MSTSDSDSGKFIPKPKRNLPQLEYNVDNNRNQNSNGFTKKQFYNKYDNQNYKPFIKNNPSPANNSNNQPNNSEANEILYIESKFDSQNRPILGHAIFNNTLVRYLCDSGADRSIISYDLYKLIKKHNHNTTLQSYSGNKMYSCIKEIKIYGVIKLKRCIISSQTDDRLENVEIIVTENITYHNCILGRDTINKIKTLKQKFKQINNIIKTMSDEVIKIFKNEMIVKRTRYQQKNHTIKSFKNNQLCNKKDLNNLKNNENIILLNKI